MSKPQPARWERPHPQAPRTVQVDDSIPNRWVVHLPDDFQLTPHQLQLLLEQYVGQVPQVLEPEPTILDSGPELLAGRVAQPDLGMVAELCPHGRRFGGFYCQACRPAAVSTERTANDGKA